MPKTKRKFIDKNNAVTFRLVHRSQQDPLVADDSAPQHVLLPIDKTKSSSVRDDSVEKRKDEQRKFGIFFDDNYNYLQHVRDPDSAPAWEMIEDRIRIYKDDRPLTNQKGAKINLPSSVFPSIVEEDVGMLNKAAPCSDPRIDWDPDIVAALDSDGEYDDGLDDDFVKRADARGNNIDGDGSDHSSDESREFGSDFENTMSDEEDDFNGEETKSRFTEYSVTSSVMRRNEGLKMLDERFEKIYEQYDDEEIGALDNEEIEGFIKPGDEIFDAALKEYEKGKIRSNVKLKDVVQPCENADSLMEAENFENVVVEEKPKEKWDCESFVSNYSNLYNHPKLITEPRKIQPLKVSWKSGLPSEGLKSQSGLTKKKLQTLDSLNRVVGDADAVTIATSNVSRASTIRPKNETPVDRKMRKGLIKAERKNRRMEKKANKLAFKDEEKQQQKTLNNLKNTVKAIVLV